jgi:hypothetical protein
MKKFLLGPLTSLRKIREQRKLLMHALKVEHVSKAQALAHHRKMDAAARALLIKSPRLSSKQKLMLVRIHKAQLAGKISEKQADALAVQNVPAAGSDWTEHAQAASTEPAIAAAVASGAAAVSTAPVSSAPVASSLETATAAASTDFTPAPASAVAAVYATGGAAPAAEAGAPEATPAEAEAAPAEADTEETPSEELAPEEESKSPNLKVIGGIALVLGGLWWWRGRQRAVIVVR